MTQNKAVNSKRLIIKASAGLAVMSLLSACGWRIRGKVNLPYSKLLISGVMTPEFKDGLRMVLKANDIEIVEQVKNAEVVLEIITEQNAKQVLSYNSSGQITAYRIISRVAFRVFDVNGVEIFPESDIFQTRDLDFNPANIQSFDFMVNEVVKNMRTDIIVQMLRRMASIKNLDPSIKTSKIQKEETSSNQKSGSRIRVAPSASETK